MSTSRYESQGMRWGGAWALALLVLAEAASAQSGPSPYRLVDDWAKLPDGRAMGAVGKVTMDPDGEHLWAVIRCDAPGEQFGWECLDSDLDPVIKFDLNGLDLSSIAKVRLRVSSTKFLNTPVELAASSVDFPSRYLRTTTSRYFRGSPMTALSNSGSSSFQT